MAKKARKASVKRKTTETSIKVDWNLDGTGKFKIDTEIGFFDHMLEQLSKHSLSDLTVNAKGDLHIDDHHTVEDCGWALGQALSDALGERRGIVRYSSIDLVMDEALVSMAIDISGRAYLSWKVDFPSEKIGYFDSELVLEFFRSFCYSARISLHVDCKSGINSHHICEACFKALGRVLRGATRIDSDAKNQVSSTKGVL